MRQAPDISRVSGSTRSLLGVGLLGEVDNSGFYVDTSGPNPTVVTLVVEVKNTLLSPGRRSLRRCPAPATSR